MRRECLRVTASPQPSDPVVRSPIGTPESLL
jgi:hypothetical protein